MQNYKLGKLPAKFDKRTLRFGAYIEKGLAPPPPAKDYSTAVSSWPMMGNDQTGDCTCAAAGHMIQEWTANNGAQRIIPDADVLTFYNHFAKGNPDAGANMLDVLKYWRKGGLDGDKIAAFTQLELKSDVEVMDAINIFGNCYIGVCLPDFAVAPGTDFLATPWVVPPQGPVGDAAPNPSNGHCIPAVGYDQHNLYVVTWGSLKSMSWQFYEAYAEEAYAVLSQDWIDKKLGRAPSGYNLAQLTSDLAAVVSA